VVIETEKREPNIPFSEEVNDDDGDDGDDDDEEIDSIPLFLVPFIVSIIFLDNEELFIYNKNIYINFYYIFFILTFKIYLKDSKYKN
jgi:hypothetical protein